jgi:DNA-binding NarL/FixJ family response regulator
MQAIYEAEVSSATHPGHTAREWKQAAQHCAEASMAWDEAYARWRAAEAGLQSTLTHEAARADLRRAHDLAVDLEATPLLNEIEALALSARVTLAPGHSPPSIPATHLTQLTQRERQILQLVVAGRTYSEIASQLVISEKTVSSHISSMLRKTNTTSRLELAQLARRVSSATLE